MRGPWHHRPPPAPNPNAETAWRAPPPPQNPPPLANLDYKNRARGGWGGRRVAAGPYTGTRAPARNGGCADWGLHLHP
eukprot:4884867-Lingulodinium_polyedra.AAC.1